MISADYLIRDVASFCSSLHLHTLRSYLRKERLRRSATLRWNKARWLDALLRDKMEVQAVRVLECGSNNLARDGNQIFLNPTKVPDPVTLIKKSPSNLSLKLLEPTWVCPVTKFIKKVQSYRELTEEFLLSLTLKSCLYMPFRARSRMSCLHQNQTLTWLISQTSGHSNSWIASKKTHLCQDW